MVDHAGVGAPRKRKEDPLFLTGASRFADDIALPGQLHGVVVRCPHAHARIRAVDATAALAAPGVRLVLTAADIEGEIVRPIPSFSRTPPFDIRGPDGAMAPEAEQFPLAGETARYAGQPVVFLVAETLAQAEDAAELVRIDYEPWPAAIGIEQALAPGAPLVWDDRPDNVSFEWEGGDRRAVDAAFARAAHVARVEVVNNRIAPVFMEPRSAVAEYDPAASRWTLRVGCQSAHGMRAVLVHMMGIDLDRLRVVVPDTGGGFGARGGVYPEYPLLLVAARRLGRPVKWTAERREAFVSDYQARDHVLRGELALDADGRNKAERREVRALDVVVEVEGKRTICPPTRCMSRHDDAGGSVAAQPIARIAPPRIAAANTAVVRSPATRITATRTGATWRAGPSRRTPSQPAPSSPATILPTGKTS
jgi:aerobic carbon-monoxide dehydrogenase large subunit